jgi:hypothetical protein
MLSRCRISTLNPPSSATLLDRSSNDVYTPYVCNPSEVLHLWHYVDVPVLLHWCRGAVASWSCGAMLVRCWSSSTVRLHDLEVGYGCFHRQRSCGNVPAHSVFKGMNTAVVPLLFNYVDRSWAMG